MKRFMGVIVGVIFLAVGLFLYFQNQRLTKVCTKETSAIVVNMKEDTQIDEGQTRYLYYPIIEYEANGKKVQATMSNGSSTPEYSINDKLTILYNPNKTDEFIIKGDKSSNIFSIVFISLGALVTVAGVVMIFKKND